MALIKGKHAGRLESRGFHDLGDLKRQAEQVLEAARVEGQGIIEAARAEASSLVEEAASQGRAEGRESGLADGLQEGRRLGREEMIVEFREQLDQLVSSWTESLSKFESDRNDMLLAAREDVLEFALAMGGKIARRVIEVDPSIVKDQVAEALSLVTEPTAVTLSINPADRKLVKSVLPKLCEQLGGCAHVDLKDDPDVERGGCVVITGKGRIDAAIECQVERIAEVLLSRTPTLRPLSDDEVPT